MSATTLATKRMHLQCTCFFKCHFQMTLFVVVVVKIVDFQIKVICSMSAHENSATAETHSEQ